MSPPRAGPTISPRSIIAEVVHNMSESAVDLCTYKLVPSAYHILLHHSDSQVLEPIRFRIIAEVQKALDKKLKQLNTPRPLRNLLRRNLPYERADIHWKIDILADPDEQTRAGECTVCSELLLPPSDNGIAGTPTRFTTTTSTSNAVVHNEEAGPAPAPPATPASVAAPAAPPAHDRESAVATIQYVRRGKTESFVMMSAELRLTTRAAGEGDLELPEDGYPGVCLLIRRDARTEMFFLQNQSEDTVMVGEKKVARGVESLLPRSAAIQPARGAKLEFRAMG
jgi:hypothetical protein